MKPKADIHVIDSPRADTYRDKVVATYNDPPELWHRVLGHDNLSFQFGLFDDAELAEGAKPGSTGPSEFRHFGRQLELAGLDGPDRPQIHRILDLGCGWGYISRYMAEKFGDCPRIDAINISPRQLEYFAEHLPVRFHSTVQLYLCNGQDVDLLPDPDVPYDLVVVRGVYTHFLNEVFEASVARVARRLAPGGTLVISDTLYRTSSLNSYRSAIPDRVDRLACGNRKTPEYFVRVLEQNGLTIQDLRVLPSAREAMHWFHKVRLNIERNFPEGTNGPIQELYDQARSFSKAVAQNQASVYSIIARRPVGELNGE